MVRDGIRRIAVFVLALSFVVGSVGGAGAPFVGDTQVDPDNVLLRVDLHSDGSATWQVEYRVLLDDENATEAFESFEEDVEANRTAYTERFGDRMRRTVSSAENATGREMAVEDVTVRTNRTTPIGPDREYGVVVYAFDWTGFAVTNGSRLEAGDAVSGLFLDEQTRMIVSWPAEYRLLRSAPASEESRDRAVIWTGRLDFEDDEPRVIVTSEPTPTTEPGAADSGGDDSSGDGSADADSGDGSDTPGTLFVVLALVAFSAIGAASWLFVRRSGRDVDEADDVGAVGEGGPSEELLSNEERVLRLLEANDGRVKQQQVAGELDWTDAKTSQVVGDLREEGAIDVFRLGRENVLSLPDEDEF